MRFKYLNYILTLMGYERSAPNRKGLGKHLRACGMELATHDCRFCLRTRAMCS